MGDETGYAGIVLEGQVRIETVDVWGNVSVTGIAEPGELIGEMYAAIPGEHFMVDIVAMEPTRALFVDVGKVLRTCSHACPHHARTSTNMVSIIARKNLWLSRRSLHMAPKSIRGKVLAYLSDEAERAAAPKFSGAVVTMVAIMGIWTMAVLMFVIFWLAMDVLLWQIFAVAVPISLITLLVLNSVWNKGRHNLVIVMALVACIAVLVYLFLLPYQPWQVFLILIPAEIVVVLSFHIRKRDHKKN